MMKLRLFSRNLARAARDSLIVISLLVCFGCTSSTAPTFLTEDIDQAIKHICKKEYKLDLQVKLIGQTVWIYMPVENLFEKSDKAEKYKELFEIEQNSNTFDTGYSTLKVHYAIKPIPEQEKIQKYKYNKKVMEQINNVWTVIRRVMFSIDRSHKNAPQFFCIVTSDIKNGFEIKELFYVRDMKKVSYDLISMGEYLHRVIQGSAISEAIIGDTEGIHLQYKDYTIEEFVAEQIAHRIKLKFQKPEVDKNADIDKEIAKLVVSTIKTYELRDFNSVEITNILTQNKTVLNKAAVWARPIEK
jgi:hypothetical protein